MAAYRYSAQASGYSLALAGFQLGLYQLLLQRIEEGPASEEEPLDIEQSLADGRWREGSFGGGSYRLRVVDESGKVNLNRANEATLRRVFANLGLGGAALDTVVDSIFDWRDADDLHRTNGAERDYYLSLKVPYVPKNGPFDTVEDLLWVRGMTQEIFYGIREDGERGVRLEDVFTVDSASNRVNLKTASPSVLHALTGLSLEQSEAVVGERAMSSDNTLRDLLGLMGLASDDEAARQFVFNRPSIVSIEAMGYAPGSRLPHSLKGVVRLLGGSQGYDVLRWEDWSSGLSSYQGQ